MKTSSDLKKILESGFSDKRSLIKEDDLELLEQMLKKLSDGETNKGYTIPLPDTIGMNLNGKLSCQIKGS